MKKINFITRFLCSCAGCDINTLKVCHSAEIKKMAIIGSCVLITPLLGIASGTFAILTFSNNLPLSIGFGLLWGFIIFLIERAVVANTKPGEFNLGVLARIFLACIFAIVISIPMELKIFDDAINEKLAVKQSRSAKAINTEYDARITRLNDDIAAEKSKVDALRVSYIGEVDGSSGSKRPFRGPIAKEKERLWNDEAAYAIKFTGEKQSEIANLNKEREERLKSSAESQAAGFLGKLMALGELSDENKTVFWKIWLLRLFLLAVELIPIFVKLGSRKNSSAYYAIAKQNGETAVLVNQQIADVRAEELVKQQKAYLSKELLDLQFSEEKAVMEHAQRRYDYHMVQMRRASERKLQAQHHIYSTVKDDDMRSQLFEQLEEIYDEFQRTLSSQVNRKQTGNDFIHDLN